MWGGPLRGVPIVGPALLGLGEPCVRPSSPGRALRTAPAAPALTAPAPPRSRDSHRGVHAHAGLPALQYLESVDVEGVAWRAGLHGRLPHRGEAGPLPVRLWVPASKPGRPHWTPTPAPAVAGERRGRGESRPQAGRGSDPPGREPPRHEGGVRDQEAGRRGGSTR